MQMNEWNCLVSNKTLWLIRRVFVDFSNEILYRCNMSSFRFHAIAKNRKALYKIARNRRKMIFRTLRDRHCVRYLRFPLKWQQMKPEVKVIVKTRLHVITSVLRKLKESPVLLWEELISPIRFSMSFHFVRSFLAEMTSFRTKVHSRKYILFPVLRHCHSRTGNRLQGNYSFRWNISNRKLSKSPSLATIILAGR